MNLYGHERYRQHAGNLFIEKSLHDECKDFALTSREIEIARLQRRHFCLPLTQNTMAPESLLYSTIQFLGSDRMN